MPTTATDRQVLAACALAIVGGCALIALGLVIETPLWVLRRLAR